MIGMIHDFGLKCCKYKPDNYLVEEIFVFVLDDGEGLAADGEVKVRALVLLDALLGLGVELDLAYLLLEQLGIGERGRLALVRLDDDHAILLVDHVAVARHTQRRQYVVARAHDGANVGRLESIDDRRGLRLQAILHDDQSHEFQIALQLLS